MSLILGNFLKSKPDVSNLPPLNFAKLQLDTIAGNKAALPAAQELTGAVNAGNWDQWLKGMNMAFPEFGAINQQVGANALSMTRGEVPISDRNMDWIQNSAHAYGGGYSGSGMDSARLARNFGLRTLDVQQQGQNAFQSWMSAIKLPNQMDVTSQMFTPQERVAAEFQQQESQFQRDYLKNTIDAQYSAGSRWASTEDDLMEML